MTNIKIKEIDEINIDDVRKVSVYENQQSFIDSVEECLEEAKLYEQWRPVAICNDDIVVGFAMYGAFGENVDTWIDRIMIDRKHQGKGFGIIAMKQLIKLVTKKYEVDTVYLSFEADNEVARKVYESLGFKFTGEYDPEGELIYKLELPTKYGVEDFDFLGIDHVNLAAPADCEKEARKFFGDILKLKEIPKPANLAKKGGVWFEIGSQQLHIGVQKDFSAAEKAHPAFEIKNIERLKSQLRKNGIEVIEDNDLEGANRFFTSDPFGNRLEFLEWV